MKVLHLIDQLGFGGAQTVVKKILESSNRMPGVESHLMALRRTNLQVSIASDRVVVCESAGRFSPGPFSEVLRYVQLHEIDCVHCHLFKSQLAGFLVKLRYRARVRVVFHEHGQVIRPESGSRLEDLLFVLFTFIAARLPLGCAVDAFLAISDYVRRRLMERARVPESKIVMLYNFVDLRDFAVGRTVSERSGTRKNRFTVGFAGRLVERKGWRVFLDAAYLLRARADVRFVLAGDGPDRERLVSLLGERAQGGPGASVEVLGFVENMADLYRTLDCFVIPSDWEPMGITELEAMACGVPVIASNVDGLNEIVRAGVTGLLFERGNASQLAERIALVAGDPSLRETLRKNGVAWAREFSLENYLRRLAAIYAGPDLARAERN